ncbi:MAG: hypothetical protein KME13_19575 [Myxacorys californica WJT36-NPBG1]|jgi:hypothetical protein|nr:hypothetical protein [Myxacorys californica WJT36-NPBG1]
MTNPAKGTFEDKTATAHAIDLLTHYSFDLGSRTAPQLLDQWLKDYSAGWIRWAVIEALYQGRYKAVSVEQILKLWQRRKQPCYHFSYEFERLVCHKFPRNLAQSPRKLAVTPVAPFPEEATLPALPAPSPPPEVEPFRPPAWSALAEQQHDEPLYDAPIEEVESELPAPEVEQDRSLDPVEALPLRSLAQVQEGMEALINQATSHLNASSEAGTKLLMEDARQRAVPIERSEAAIADHHAPTAPSSSQINFEPDSAESENGVSIPSAASEELLSNDTEVIDDSHLPIHQFTPTPVRSDFHSKLRAVVDQELKDLRS